MENNKNLKKEKKNKYVKPEALVISTPDLMQLVGPNAGSDSYTIIGGAKGNTWEDFDEETWSETNQGNSWSKQ